MIFGKLLIEKSFYKLLIEKSHNGNLKEKSFFFQKFPFVFVSMSMDKNHFRNKELKELYIMHNIRYFDKESGEKCIYIQNTVCHSYHF